MHRWPLALAAILVSLPSQPRRERSHARAVRASRRRAPPLLRRPARAHRLLAGREHAGHAHHAARRVPLRARRAARHPALHAPTARRCARVRLDRPLDFAAVTDHAEQIGEVRVCQTPGAPGYDSWMCRALPPLPARRVLRDERRATRRAASASASAARAAPAASQPRARSGRRRATPPRSAYDRSAACRFTSFVALRVDRRGADNGKNLHRNVIFRERARAGAPDQRDGDRHRRGAALGRAPSATASTRAARLRRCSPSRTTRTSTAG